MMADVDVGKFGFEISEGSEGDREANQTRVREFVNNLIDCYFQSDRFGKVSFVNASGARRFGYASPSEMIGLSVSDLYADPTQREAVLRQLDETGAVADWTGQARRKDGSTFWFSMNAQFVRDSDGQVIGTEGVIRDISERKVAERAIVESARRFRQVFETAPIPLAYFPLDGSHMVFNDQFVSLFGYTKEDIRGLRDWRRLASPDAAYSAYLDAEYPKLIQLAKLNQGKIQPIERKYRCKDGTIVTGLISGSIVEDTLLLAFVDLTERLRVENELRESEERFRTLFEESPVAAGISRKGVALQVNRAYLSLFGFETAAQVFGVPLTQFFSEEARSAIREVSAKRAQGLAAPNEYDAIAQRADGSQFPAHVMVRTVNLPDGPASVGFIADLTERERAEKERRQVQATLAQSDRLASMGMLAAGVAHEINNPLTYVLYNLQSLADELPLHVRRLAELRSILQESPASTNIGEALELLDSIVWQDSLDAVKQAVDGARRIKEIARGLSTFSRVEEDELVALNLRHPIESAIQIARNTLKYRARIDRDLAATASILGNEGKLSQVFLNLLVNAAHSMPEGHVEDNTILLRTWEEGEEVCAEVRDTGHGIAPEDLERVFEPFFTTKPVGVGSGLGLSIVRNIVSHLGGTISVVSELGVGTSFRLRFPMASPPPSRKVRGAADPEPLGFKGRILIVDDDAGVRTALARVCKAHDVKQAQSGTHARSLLSADTAFDMILCDVMMPQGSGIELHRWLLEFNPGLAQRVVFISGGTFTPDAKRYLENLENPCIEKPFEIPKLRKLIAEWLTGTKQS